MVSEYIYDGVVYFVEFTVFDDGSVQINGVYTDEDLTDGLYVDDVEFENYLISEIRSENRHEN